MLLCGVPTQNSAPILSSNWNRNSTRAGAHRMNSHVFLPCFETYKLDFRIEKFYTDMKISLYVQIHIKIIYPDNFAFLIVRILELFTR